VIHVYAFAGELRSLPALDGLDGAVLERRRLAGLDAVISRRTHPTTGDSLQADALVHGEIVEALLDLAASVLPVRFGEGAGDDRELAQTVGERSVELRRALDRVCGCVEVGLRISGREAARAAGASSGTAYMRVLRDLEEERRTTIGALHDDLACLARGARVEAPAPAGLRHAAAYLVERDGLAAVSERTARFAAENPQLSILCTGPWAPYSFVGEAA
jgi:gas vesicle protein GvpL/GvpF